MKQQELILQELKSMGFDPVDLGKAGLAFKYENLSYLYMPDKDDENFLRISIPQLFDVTDENRIAVLNAMHETTLTLKYAKTCIMYEESVWAIYEHYLHNTENLSELLEHIIRTLEATAVIFFKTINGEDIPGRSDESDENLDEALEAELLKLLEDADQADS